MDILDIIEKVTTVIVNILAIWQFLKSRKQK